jgi:S-adenosylmethionine/arginine decarboxylase-like enzyme
VKTLISFLQLQGVIWMGKHLIIDAGGIDDTKLLNSITKIKRFLSSIPGLVGLIPLGKPNLKKATDKTADGVTGIQLLTTSHASIHTWSNGERQGRVNIDVFSCEDFDECLILDAVKGIFNPKNIEHQSIRRV